MMVTGEFPAPGPQDRESRDWSHIPPPAGGPASRPQSPMLTAHKPGIVPLRPLQLGDILDGAVKAVRFNPKSMVGLSALVLAVFLIPSAALGVGSTHLMASFLNRFGPEAQALLGAPSSLIQSISTGLATALLSGLLIQVVGQAVLGRKDDIGMTWRTTRGRLLPLLALVLLTGAFSLVTSALLLGPGVLLVVNDTIGAGVILLLLGLVCTFALALYVSTKIALAAPAIVLEGHGVIAGLRRSFALTKGAAVFCRILRISLAAGILAAVVGALLGAPFSIIGVAIAAIAGQDSEGGQLVVTFVSHLSALLSGAITTPFVAAVTGLLYIDRRMRLEALDVVLVREAQTNPAPRI